MEYSGGSTILQEMVKTTTMASIPRQYLVDQQHHPALAQIPYSNYNNYSIPIIDLHSLLLLSNNNNNNNDYIHQSPLQNFHSVCKQWGIFQLVNHGVDSSLLVKLEEEIHGFYRLPLEERLSYRLRPGEVEGYGQTVILSDGQKVDWADRFYMITNPTHMRKPHLLPLLPPSLRETLEAYLLEQQKLSMTILRLIAQALGINTKQVEEMFEDGMQSMRMNYYPPCPEPDKVMGLTPHSDACGITILHQVNGVDGFQVKKDGIWMPVQILPNALVVNLGDIIEILSNGLYRSIEHRAMVNSGKARISIAMFFSPNLEAEVGPMQALLTGGRKPLFRSIKTKDYVKEFFTRKLNGKSYLHDMKL